MIYTRLGRAYLAERSPVLAAAAFEKTLERVRNDAFALAGLVEAYAALGEKAKAKSAMENLLFTWSDADAGLPWMERAKAAGVAAKPLDNSPRPQRNYRQTSLEHFGPNMWTPYEAPLLDALDSKNAKVTLTEYRGKNVVLIFYLGEECPHCLEQLVQAGKKKDEFGRLNTEVLAISPNSPSQNQASLKLGAVPFRLLSDAGLENARRFQSYDDFESLELHSTILIDKNGRVHWARSGGDPFIDFEFLFREIRQLNAR
ncbi:MAG: peroxiredoxin family protein [Bryobacteraceae bacterium]